ncbi:MAG TPA: PEP-CTERM sorting domain-containing protein [Terriglobales bacterium]|nr:PEP-CTERM sorting domain-containing protein [Terriglobales bacterium]
MRRVFIVALLALVLPMAAWADGIDLVNKFGSIAISSAGIVSHGSQLKQYNGITSDPGHALGSVTFSTGALLSGSILTGGTFSDVGSSFVVIGKGNKVPHKGVIFDGAFVGPVSWTLVAQSGQSLTYELSGAIQGTLWNGHFVTGTTTQTIYSTNGQITLGIGHIHTGETSILTPEPGTLGLLGTGLLAIAGMLRRKLSASA